MNDILKQRLVGALILVALGVVFWPIIFVEPGDEAVAQQARIPPRPEVVTTPIAVPDMAGLRASPERAVPAETEPVEPPAPEPELAPVIDDLWERFDAPLFCTEFGYDTVTAQTPSAGEHSGSARRSGRLCSATCIRRTRSGCPVLS